MKTCCSAKIQPIMLKDELVEYIAEEKIKEKINLLLRSAVLQKDLRQHLSLWRNPFLLTLLLSPSFFCFF